MSKNNLLLDEQPIVVIPKLAKLVGINEAIILQQIHYWLKKQANIIENRAWVYNTYEDWAEQFSWLHLSSIKRIINKLHQQGLLIIRHFNNNNYNRMNWYSINYDALETLLTTNEEITITHEPAQTEQKPKTDKYYLHLLPDNLNNSSFIEKWKEWVEYRRQLKKSIKETTAKYQLKLLANQPEPLEIIDNSIRNGWVGLFPLTKKNDSPELRYEDLLKQTTNMTPEERLQFMRKYKHQGNKYILTN